LVRGTVSVDELTVAQACRLVRVSRSQVDRQLGRHSSIAVTLAKAFKRASAEERIAFVRSIGCEQIWNALQAAL
jgi:hypothetical protein